ncbi:hypothetical protein [Gymnodinialimonas hymeniacidonis]|uniref:hypothetical protein n=1 Tax=Gymnodinialimonas hymeniacidonis TaxID=3126508 RepID=UPI0034C5D3B6
MHTLIAALTFATAIAFAVVPVFTQPFTGFDPAQLPIPVERLPIQPAGYAFALWGLIYLGLIASAAYGLFKHAIDPDWAPFRPWLIISMVLGAAWIPVALAAPVPATVMIIAMWASALAALLRSPATPYARAPIGLYTGWLTAASCVAASTVAAGYGLASQNTASWIALAIALIATITITRKTDTLAYPGAVVWALIGTMIANWNIFPAFATAAALGALLLIAIALGRRIEAQST